jgi:Prenyltransferase and squalene oxidase repeat
MTRAFLPASGGRQPPDEFRDTFRVPPALLFRVANARRALHQGADAPRSPVLNARTDARRIDRDFRASHQGADAPRSPVLDARTDARRIDRDFRASHQGADAPRSPVRETRIQRAPRAFALFFAAALSPFTVQAQVPLADVSAAAPNPKADAALKRALDYLKSSQKPDGAWESGSFGKATSITSLSVMAYLAAGHVPGEPGPYRDTIQRGIRYVLDNQKPNGLLVSNTSHGPMYCHGISTLMLAEVVGMTPDTAMAADARGALAKAVDVIVKAQGVRKNPDNAGGWRYQITSPDSDLSVTGWQVMALRAAKSAGCAVSSEPIDKAIAYVKKCAFKTGGFGYQPGQGPNNPRTGTGMLALEICGEHLSTEATAGAEYLIKHPPRWSSEYFFYEVYYCSQAMFQVGDKYFQNYYPKIVDILLQHQDKNGSWLSGDGNDRTGGRDYCTAVAVLALAVEYRYLPIYQR